MRTGENKCFAVSPKGGCTILTKTKCNYEVCTFYKTEEEKLESERKAKKRCADLGITYVPYDSRKGLR